MKNRNYFHFILFLLKPYKLKIFLLTFLMIITGIGNMIIPLLQRQIVDVGILGSEFEVLLQIVVITISLYFLIAYLTYMQTKIQVDINCDFEKQLQIKIMEHLLKIRKDILDKEGVLKLSKDADYCVETIALITGSSVLQLLTEVFKLLGIIIALLIINWKVALFAFSFLPLKFIVTALIGKYAQKYSMKNIFEHQKLHIWEEDTFSTIPEIKIWNLYDKKQLEYSSILTEILEIIKKSNLLMAKDTRIGDSLSQLIFNLLYLLAGIMIWDNTLTIGGLLVITSYFSYVLEPVSLFSSISIIFSRVKPAIDRYIDYMNLDEEICIENDILPKEMNITFENVSFSYGNNMILENVNLNINSGIKYAIVGENGAGKTTLIDLILRFIDLKKGAIKVNGKDISKYYIEDYREKIGVVTQQTNLFNATIKDNITIFGRYKLDNGIMDYAIFEFIKKMPEGIMSKVGSKSSMLSGGEKQKIALARALMRKPSLLVLDEPTSNYDAESKILFYQLIRSINCTAIIVSHERDILKEVDKIIFVEHGNVKIFNSFEEFEKFRPTFFGKYVNLV